MRDKLVGEIPYLRRFARGLARDRSRADDLVQECVERALTREHLYDPSRNLRTWLFTILRNLYLNKIRDERARPVVSEAKFDELLAAPPGGSQFDVVLARQVLTAMEALSVEHREVLLLVAVEGLSYRETAEIIGTPTGTVMSRLARAREQLRIQIEGGPRSQIRRVK